MLVGKEAFCDFHTIQEAVNALESQPEDEERTLYILSGVYEETVRIYRSHLRIIGIGHVVITMNRYARELDAAGEEITTFATPTLFLGGHRLVVENLTVANTAGQGTDIGQAVAVYAHCDETVFRNCTFKGYQDTLLTGPLPPATKEGKPFGGIPLKKRHDRCRQLYTHCYIEGTVDFIFGGAVAYFEHCEIRSLLHYGQGEGYITAASTPEGQEYGYIFSGCFLTADPGVTGVYLGRPWRSYAQTELVNCRYGRHIDPRGWDHWDDPHNERTVRYCEYGVAGDDPLRGQRADWALLPDMSEEAPGKAQIFVGTDFWKRVGTHS
ncbi:pectinesterase family protein [Paenibacillus sp. P32E]|uniref:pectinesterase family protein n=1 Tax=Paenibacillus sp. P32E TaxID=1349434 RepID=UPI00093C1755|nr:pectinesterase family protein [Paenibacillus sp. P32E]OKP90233.1 pectin methylesterase [Paenibacillus sp. P32E]